MNHKEVEEYLLSKPGAWLDYPFGEDVAVYKIGPKDSAKMFALIKNGSNPAQVSLKCDPLLAQTLRDKYETVMPGYHLNKRLWNTIVCSGQLSKEELFDLIDLSYRLVSKGLTNNIQSTL